MLAGQSVVKKIESTAKNLGEDVYNVCKTVLEDERFPIWSGSSQDHQHHYGDCGLAVHTLEVIEICFKVRNLYQEQYRIDEKELFLSAFFHDVGKMWDYERRDGVWTSASHKRFIHHISRSGIIWSENAIKEPAIYDKYFEPVLHAILAHHMCREFGSPVAPRSRVAWLLTLCDNISARMYDADTFDVIGRK